MSAVQPIEKPLSSGIGKYIPELDGFRALPLFFVMWGHFGIQYSHFWLPVQGFFVLSGFLISKILIKEKEKEVPFKVYFRTYWWRRVLRIFPVYFLYLFILGMFYLFAHYPQDLPKLFLSLITYTFNIYMPFAPIDAMHSEALYVTQHLWTMSVEEQFYIFLPLFIFFIPKKQFKAWTIALIVIPIFFRYFYGQYLIQNLEFPQATGASVRLNTFSHFDAFFMGVAINAFGLVRIITKWWWWTIAVFILVIALGAVNIHSHLGRMDWDVLFSNSGFLINWYENYEHVWSYSLVNLGFMLCILALLSENSKSGKSIWTKILRFKPLVLAGKVSYGMYTYHMLVLAGFHTYAFPNRRPEIWINVLWFLVYVLVVFGLSVLSYEFFEKRFLKLKPAYAPMKTNDVPPLVKEESKR